MTLSGQATVPVDVDVTPDRLYRITWADGHVSAYTLAYLRRRCPCAGCRTETDKTQGLILLAGGPPTDVQVLTVEPQGSYAIKFGWSDGHDTGIYSFEYLRQICPCPVCSPPA